MVMSVSLETLIEVCNRHGIEAISILWSMVLCICKECLIQCLYINYLQNETSLSFHRFS
jgi:hypothetical protein